jgi:hypothetical protein
MAELVVVAAALQELLERLMDYCKRAPSCSRTISRRSSATL